MWETIVANATSPGSGNSNGIHGNRERDSGFQFRLNCRNVTAEKTPPKIFVSGTRDDLGSCCSIVCETLVESGYCPATLDCDLREISAAREILREKIADCDAVFLLVGECYGAAPVQSSGEARLSYAQMGLDIARELKKFPFILVFAENFPYDAHEPEPEDRRALQQQYRGTIISTECCWEISDRAELTECLRKLLRGEEHLKSLISWVSSSVRENACAPGDPTPTIKDEARVPNTTPFNENVQFTAYRPKVIAPAKWTKMLVFAHLDDRPAWLDDDQLGPIEEMELEATRILGSKIEGYRQTTSDSSVAIPEDGEITMVPDIRGIEFNPPRRAFFWKDGVIVHHETFDIRAIAALDGQTARGQLTIFLGHIILADIPLVIRVDSKTVSATESSSAARERSSAPAFRRVFTSYSRRDLPIVEATERYGRTLGDEYIRDLIYLRSGELWNDQLRELVRWADVFQLFWSANSARSEFVESEWRYALSLNRPVFVRPTYWQEPMPEPPEPLRGIHFHRLAIEIPPPKVLPPSIQSGPSKQPDESPAAPAIPVFRETRFMPSSRPVASEHQFMPSPAPTFGKSAREPANARPAGLSPRTARLIFLWIVIASVLLIAILVMTQE